MTARSQMNVTKCMSFPIIKSRYAIFLGLNNKVEFNDHKFKVIK